MKYVFLQHLIWEDESTTLDESIDAFVEEHPFLYLWKDLIEWSMQEDTIYMETRVEGHRTLCVSQDMYIPYYYGMMVKEIECILSLLYPGRKCVYRLYYDAWYEPNDVFVSLPFHSTHIRLDLTYEPMVVSIS